jgi:hypothetical protein
VSGGFEGESCSDKQRLLSEYDRTVSEFSRTVSLMSGSVAATPRREYMAIQELLKQPELKSEVARLEWKNTSHATAADYQTRQAFSPRTIG